MTELCTEELFFLCSRIVGRDHSIPRYNRRLRPTREKKGWAMKTIFLGLIFLLSPLAESAVLYGQSSDSYGNHRTTPTEPPGSTGFSNVHNGSHSSRVPGLLPDSHIPPRSPDLGSPTFPLSPSIGPGAGLLGPESGPGPARLRSGHEPENMKRYFDRPAP